MDGWTGVERLKDHDLGFYRMKSNLHMQYEIIPLHSIIRGAYIIPDYEHDDEYLIVDTIDADMFLRLKSLVTEV